MILDTIVEKKKLEVGVLRQQGLTVPSRYRDKEIEPPRGFRKALLSEKGLAVIAEVKKASPSKGVISKDFNPRALALNYQKNGASCVSVLTDVDFFQGSLRYLMDVRDEVQLPVLRKDFIIDELQVKEAHMAGADAILLIVAILELNQMVELQDQAKSLGMDVLTEVHTEYEVEQALAAKCDLIGVNNRNLNDFSVDINTTFRLKKYIPDDIPLVSESGLKTKEDFLKLQQEGVQAALVGETLMRAGDDSSLLSSLLD